VTAIDNSPSGVTTTLDDGTRVEADLLAGADGRHSGIRRLVFGPEDQFFRYLGFYSAAYIFDNPETHARLHDRFWLTDTTMQLMGL
jgi:2-polyprenyl-6-methoxyphenol hydroxylase-like FAD-dependent oxidoreductase